MENKGRKITGSMRGIFGVMVLGICLFLVLGELMLPEEKLLETGKCEVLEGEWTRILPDGSRRRVQVPGSCEADRLESVSIETVLPGEITEDTWLCVRSSLQDMEIFVDQILRTRYTPESVRSFGKNSVSAYIFQKLEREDAGKVLRITTVSDSSYTGVLNTVYIGDRMGILSHFLTQYGLKLLLAVVLMSLSGLSILVCMVLHRFFKKILLEHLSWSIFLCSVWLVANSGIRQFLFRNLSVAANLAFLAAMLMPFPFLIYMDGVQKHRYRKGYIVIEFLALADFAVCSFQQMTGWLEFLDAVIFIFGILFVSFFYILFTMCMDIKRKKLREYRLVALGCLFLVLTAIGELVIMYRKLEVYSGTLLSTGLVVLLVMAMIETTQRLLDVEREKQRAVLANASKGQFLANMSHEIRTPINTVIGMNEMILRENQDAAIQEYAENINSASKTLLSLVNDVLDFSKMESGCLELTHSSYYLSSLLNDTIHVLKARAEKKKLKIRLNVEEDLPSILVGDEVRIRKVLGHLFSNSVKFTEEGSITFSVRGEWSDDGAFCLSFSVADTGIGIQKEELGKIYDSFTRLEKDRNCSIEGSGLGLNLTKQLVEQMKGEIKVYSVYGKGTLFTVRIPQEVMDREPIGDLQSAYERELAQTAQHRNILKAPNASVLAVDDNEMNLAVVRGLLKRTGIQLDTAAGGRECLIYTRRKKYDLILMDHMMPEPDGIETLHLLRGERENPNITTRIVALTANAVAGSREVYLKEGFDDYLSKPVVAEKLEQMLSKHLPKELVHFQEEKPLENKPLENKPLENKAEADLTDRKAEKPEAALIDQKAGMPYCGNDEEMYREILEAYYQQGQTYLVELPKRYQEKDWKNYSIIAHAIKSTSLTIGAVTVSKQAKEQELAGKENRIEVIEAKWESFYQDYQTVLKEAAHILGIEKAAEGEAGQEQQEEDEGFDWETYQKECQILLTQIQGYEMSEALEQIRKLLARRQETALEQVKEAVNKFDYDHAEEILQSWLKEREVQG